MGAQLRGGAIYTLADPMSGEVRYVGKTQCAIEKRMREHLSRARSGARHPRVYTWLRSVDLAPVVQVVEEASSWADLNAAEMRWIEQLRASGARLVNHTDGGEGAVGFRHNDATKQLMSSLKQGRRVGPKWSMRALTAQEEAQVKAMYLEGKSCQTISADLGGKITHGGVRKVLLRQGVEMRKAVVGRWLSARQGGVVTPHRAKSADVLALYARGLSSEAVGRELGMSGRTVLSILHANGAAVRPSRHAGRSIKEAI